MKFRNSDGHIFYANLFDVEKSGPTFKEHDLETLNNKLIEHLGKTFVLSLAIIKKKIDSGQFKTFYNIHAINDS